MATELRPTARAWQSPLDDRWYWYGETAKSEKNNASLPHGVNCYSAADLKGPWRFERRALQHTDVQVAGQSGPWLIERPKVVYNSHTETFVMWFHLDDEEYRSQKVGVATSQYANGRFAFVKALQPDGLLTLDMSLFHDPLDGHTYFIRNVNNRYVGISRLSQDYLRSTGLITKHSPVFDAMSLFRLPNGTLYCMSSQAHGFRYASPRRLPSPLVLWRATGTSLDDPKFVDWGNPTDQALSFNSQPSSVVSVTSAAGEPYFIYMGDNWEKGGDRGLPDASYVWLPLRFTHGKAKLRHWPSWDVDYPFGCKGDEMRAGCCGMSWSEKDALCYAELHHDLRAAYCLGSDVRADQCDTDGLRCHYWERGAAQGYKLEGCTQLLPSPSPLRSDREPVPRDAMRVSMPDAREAAAAAAEQPAASASASASSGKREVSTLDVVPYANASTVAARCRSEALCRCKIFGDVCPPGETTDASSDFPHHGEPYYCKVYRLCGDDLPEHLRSRRSFEWTEPEREDFEIGVTNGVPDPPVDEEQFQADQNILQHMGSKADMCALPEERSADDLRAWKQHDGSLNCFDGKGAPGASGDASCTEVSLDLCQRACVRTPWCHALVVKLSDDDEGARQLEACWMREVVEPDQCVHGSDYELFTIDAHEQPSPSPSPSK